MNKEFFIGVYVANYLAGMYVKRSDEHMHTGKHPYTRPREVPIEDAWFMAEVAWRAYEAQSAERAETPLSEDFICGRLAGSAGVAGDRREGGGHAREG